MQPSALTDGAAGRVWATYTEDYTYDDGNNLTVIAHTGGSGDRTVTMTVAAGSNRAVTQDSGTTPDAGFLTGGLQKALSDGRLLSWHADNQLKQVSPVVRENSENDTEHYHYADGGTRTRKIRTTVTAGGTLATTTTYAGGTETRQRHLTDTLQLDVAITEGDGVRLIRNNLTGEVHLRYSFSDHLDSCGGEMDEQGNITAREEYLPYGGSAGNDEEVSEVADRTVRYSGKKRDATGLMYYGWRYYQPETGRWLSSDPGGLVDGPNLFRFVQNNPLRLFDPDGQAPLPYQINEESEKSTELNFGPIHTRGMTGPESMAPEKAKNLRAALSLTSELITDVRDKARTKAIPGFSGVQAPELEKDLQKMLDMMADYQEGQKHAEAFAVYALQSGSSEEGYAHVYPDNDHNIYLGPHFFTAGPIMQTKVLIHEFSHLALGTKDYRYSYEADKLLATGGLKPEYLTSLKKFLSEMATGPVTDTNPEPGKDFVTMMKTYNQRLVQAGIADQLSSLQAFLSEHVPEEHGLVSALNALSSKPAVIKKSLQQRRLYQQLYYVPGGRSCYEEDEKHNPDNIIRAGTANKLPEGRRKA